ncbi:FliH/SctL family protein [Polycladidibacter hongkongensis]|uniref:FliH/SctL family protein n=1 Tax=Polycladidibacter hongkongensis TaxID=1647556 RepID=UPI00083785BF|nr:FliH/SctL family protein [Pseudovibrio hongkongensis]
MAKLYRLKEMGVQLEAGVHILKAAELTPLETAEHIIAQAQAEADRIIAEAGQVFADQKQRGYADGRQLAEQEAAQRMVQEHAALDQQLQEIEHDIVTAMVSMLRRILDEFSDVEKLRLMARAMLKTLRAEKRVKLHVAPEFYAQTVAMVEEISAGFKQVELLEVVEDGGLSGTNITLEAAVGRVDGNLQLRLEEVDNALRAALGGGGDAASAVSEARYD